MLKKTIIDHFFATFNHINYIMNIRTWIINTNTKSIKIFFILSFVAIRLRKTVADVLAYSINLFSNLHKFPNPGKKRQSAVVRRIVLQRKWCPQKCDWLEAFRILTKRISIDLWVASVRIWWFIHNYLQQFLLNSLPCGIRFVQMVQKVVNWDRNFANALICSIILASYTTYEYLFILMFEKIYNFLQSHGSNCPVSKWLLR